MRIPPLIYRQINFLILAIICIFLLFPVIAIFLYAVALDWGAELLPKGWTLSWLTKLWMDKRFLLAFKNSLLISIISAIITIIVCLPVLLWAHTRLRRFSSWINVLIAMPFAIPPVVSSTGLLQLYSDGMLHMTGKPLILVGCYFIIAVPFVYRAIDNNMRALQVKELLDTAQLLGSSTWQALWYVILPNLKNGILMAFFISLSFLMGEFVFANILVGSRFETLQVYLYSLRNLSGHYTSALVASYFFFIAILTFIINLFNSDQKKIS